MKHQIGFLVLAINLFQLPAFADSNSASFKDNSKCVSVGIDRIHEWATQYTAYASLEGATYSNKVRGENVQIIRLSEVEPVRDQKIPGYSGLPVKFAFQPSNLTVSDLYPRFMADCVATHVDKTHYVHECTMDKSTVHFAVTDYHARLEAEENSSACPEEAKTHLKFKFSVSADPDQMEQISKAIVDGWIKEHKDSPGFRNFILFMSKILPDNIIFSAFQTGFYDSWVKGL